MDITEFRKQYPQYNDLSDSDLADALYTKFYSDMPRGTFEGHFRPSMVAEEQASQPMRETIAETEALSPTTFQEPPAEPFKEIVGAGRTIGSVAKRIGRSVHENIQNVDTDVSATNLASPIPTTPEFTETGPSFSDKMKEASATISEAMTEAFDLSHKKAVAEASRPTLQELEPWNRVAPEVIDAKIETLTPKEREAKISEAVSLVGKDLVGAKPYATPVDNAKEFVKEAAGMLVGVARGVVGGVTSAGEGLYRSTKYINDKLKFDDSNFGRSVEEFFRLAAVEGKALQKPLDSALDSLGASKLNRFASETVGAIVPMVVEFGKWWYGIPLAMVQGAEQAKEQGRNEAVGALVGGFKRFLMEKILNATGMMKRTLGLPIFATMFGADEAINGKDGTFTERFTHGAGAGIILSVFGPKGKVGTLDVVNEARLLATEIANTRDPDARYRFRRKTFSYWDKAAPETREFVASTLGVDINQPDLKVKENIANSVEQLSRDFLKNDEYSMRPEEVLAQKAFEDIIGTERGKVNEEEETTVEGEGFTTKIKRPRKSPTIEAVHESEAFTNSEQPAVGERVTAPKKEPWQLTKSELLKRITKSKTALRAIDFDGKLVRIPGMEVGNDAFTAREVAEEFHQRSILQALADGKQVSENVLKDYPKLTKLVDLKGNETDVLRPPTLADRTEIRTDKVDRVISETVDIPKVYMSMPIDEVRKQAKHGVVVAQKALEFRTKVESRYAELGIKQRTKEQRGSVGVATMPTSRPEWQFGKEQEAGYQAAKGVPVETVPEKTGNRLKDFWNKLTREYEFLPKTSRFADARFTLKNLEKSKTTSDYVAKEYISSVLSKLDRTTYDLFERKVYLDDLASGAERGHQLPHGWTPDLVSEALAKVDAEVRKDTRVMDALAERKRVWNDLRTRYLAAMNAIGIDMSERFKNDRYFRHMVLEYATVNNMFRATRKPTPPTGSSFLRRRKGSTLSYNTDYIESEYDVMSKMLNDIDRATAVKRLKDNYDISERVKADAKKKGLEDWREAIPEGYETYSPREGHSFFFADSVPERLSKQLWQNKVEELGVAKEDLRKVLAMGGKYAEWVIPSELKNTFEAMVGSKQSNVFIDSDRAIIKSWKVWQLLSPRRMFKYNFRNLAGDADAVFMGNPSTFKHVGRAAKELYDVYYGKKGMSPELQEWFKRGGFEANLQTQEMGEIKKLWPFERLYAKELGGAKIPESVWKKYWRSVRIATDMREAVLRYATYLDYMQQMGKNNGTPKNFGASIPEEIMALSDVRDRAYWLSNDLLGAYDRVGVVGQSLSTHLYPFWRWKEVNFTRYKRLLQNAINDDKLAETVGRKAASIAIRSPIIAMRIGRFVLKATAFWTVLQAWNNLMYQDLEDKLPETVRTSPHIIFGKDKYGETIYFNRIGALGDLIEWFGIDAAPMYVSRWMHGKATLKETATEMAKDAIWSAPNIMVQGSRPFVKLTGELIFKQSLFPEMLKRSTIRDPYEYIAQSFGLENEYRALAGKPSKGYGRSVGTAFVYTVDPSEGAYRTIIDEVSRFKQKIGKTSEGFWLTPQGDSLYYMKLALRYGDKKAFEKYSVEYFNHGGTKEGMGRSLMAMAPLSGLNQMEQNAFISTLKPEDYEMLKQAYRFYADVLGGKRFEERDK